MTLIDELRRYESFQEFHRRNVTIRPCESFADICWDHVDPLSTDPGVLLETIRRVTVIQRINSEIRYYAGGWGTQESRDSEPYEFGIFGSLDDAIEFTEAFLFQHRKPSEITTPRIKKGGTELLGQ